ncbi:NAD(P)H-dependent glycerol-3-phosphate dehydrogenase [Patulibacter minatonensis]|uniref:NAD(P)H-dependent glycerol-3-phosphate dehydrogenase n=1 Tax=Patulibacter minatonensis TaxID=298163 RepID=UPI000479A4D5|nr:NAD(P)H-dependent glycerol-3-phosphate dehydrogenase [Patulibacter minatonensis]
MTKPVNVVVLGGGSWATTVASLAATNTPTTIWARDADVARDIDEHHRNSRFLEDRPLTESLRGTDDLAAAVAKADVLVMGVPSQALREVAGLAAPHLRPWVPVLSLSKGIEVGTRLRPTQIIGSVLPGHPIGLLAGPNLAREILDGKAAAAVVATPDTEVAKALQPLFSTPLFRVYRNADVVGSELGGALKNVIAIASGMADGLGVGDNTRAMVVTRGLAEVTRLGVALGGDPVTFTGLTGLGDLLATCSSKLSRNRRVGEELGSGKTIEEVLAGMSQVAEGVKSVRTVLELAAMHDVSMPIAEEVDAVVNEGRSARDAYRGLRAEAAQSEHHEVA